MGLTPSSKYKRCFPPPKKQLCLDTLDELLSWTFYVEISPFVPCTPAWRVRVFEGYNKSYPYPYLQLPLSLTCVGFHTRVIHKEGHQFWPM